MYVGFFTAPFQGQSLRDTLEFFRKRFTPEELRGVEIGTGNYPGGGHCDLEGCLDDNGKREDFKRIIADNSFVLSALSCHGNPLHPNPETAKTHNDVQEKTIRLAPQVGTDKVVAFSGLPGDGSSKVPVWCTNAWPDEHADLYRRQLTQVAEYWDRLSQIADKEGVDICFEGHPKFFIHNPGTFFEVKNAVKERQAGKPYESAYNRLKVNLDPSHLIWRGMVIEDVIAALGKDIGYVHAKDAKSNPRIVRVNGNIDATPFSKPAERAWNFVYVGSGDVDWPVFVRNLRLVGYDGVFSVEHEDGLMDPLESFDKAIGYLNKVIMKKPAGKMTWAAR